MKDEAAITAIFNKERTHVLLIKRRDVPVWVLPGGQIEPGEQPEEAAEREAEEETGCKISIEQHIGIYTPINRLTRKTYLYSGSLNAKTQTSSEEAKEIQFFPLKKLPKMLPPPFDIWINDAHQKSSVVIERELKEITYTRFILTILSHPILVFRFILSRFKMPLNS